MKTHKTHELGRRLLLTALVLAVYMAGRSVPLSGIDLAAHRLEGLENIMTAMVSGDRHQTSVFALGIMPYMISNLAVWLFMAIGGPGFRSRCSQQNVERATLVLMLAISVVLAVSRAEGLIFGASRFDIRVLRAVAVLEMVAGAAMICGIATLNKNRGIGGQSPIMLVNVVDNLVSTIWRFPWQQLQTTMGLCLVMAAVILVMEQTIIRIPVQRVSIHNLYADKSYIAFKLDPVGVMPVMFAVSLFMIPQLIVRFFLWIDGDSQTLQLIYGKLELTNAVGGGIYLGSIFTLNILLSFVTLAPGELAEQLQKAGDSIVGVYAGKKTKRYLRRKLLLLDVFSGGVLCLLMGISLRLAQKGEISPNLALLPATAMILTGILCPLYQEVKAYWKFDSYSLFI